MLDSRDYTGHDVGIEDHRNFIVGIYDFGRGIGLKV